MPWRPLNREQAWMLPPTLDELMPADHPARFVAEFVDALGSEEWAELGVKMDGEPLGAPGYHPRALLSVWLYGFMSGVRSSRKLEAACRDQVPYLWLTGRQHPDHNTLWRFYAQHRRAMRTLFDRTVRTAVAMDLVDLAVQAVDGTKVGANASLRRTRDTAALGRLTERLEQAIDDLEAQGEAGTDAVPARLPQQLASQQALRARVREAMEELAERPELRRINLTDPEARLMKTPHGIVPGYNAQAMVSPAGTDRGSGGMLVTAAEVVDAPVDNEQLAPMLERARETTGMAAALTPGRCRLSLRTRARGPRAPGAAGGDAGGAAAPIGAPLPQGSVPLRGGARPLHLSRRAAATLPPHDSAPGRAAPGVPVVRGGLRSVSGVRGLYEHPAWPQRSDRAAGRGAAPAPGVDDDGRGESGVPAPGGVGRTSLWDPQGGTRCAALPAPRSPQRGGRMDGARHGLQSAHAVAGMAHRSAAALEQRLGITTRRLNSESAAPRLATPPGSPDPPSHPDYSSLGPSLRAY